MSDATTFLRSLDGDIRGWDGRVETASALLKRFDAASSRGVLENPTLETLRKILTSHSRLLKKLLSGDDPDLPLHPVWKVLAAAEPDIGFPWKERAGAALTERLFELDPAPARLLSRRVSQLAVLIAPLGGSLDWLKVAFGFIQREHWIPAAAALAIRATDDQPGALAEFALESGQKSVRDRHTRVLGSLVTTHQPKFQGKDAAAWFKEITKDDYDLSALAAACAEMGRQQRERQLKPDSRLAQLGEQALEVVLVTNAAIRITYQHAEAARDLIEVFGNDLSHARRLLSHALPENKPDLGLLVGRLWAAHETLKWAERRGDDALAEELRAGPLRTARRLLDTGTVDATTWSTAFSTSLRELSPDTWEGAPFMGRAVTLATALELVAHPDAESLDWPAVVNAAGATWLRPARGTVGVKGWSDLIGFAAQQGALFQEVMHRHVDRPIDSTEPRRRAIEGLSRILKARWRGGPSSDANGWFVNFEVSNQCARQLVRRLAVADSRETAVLTLATLVADSPPGSAHRVIRSTEKADPLGPTMEEELPAHCGRVARQLAGTLRTRGVAAKAPTSSGPAEPLAFENLEHDSIALIREIPELQAYEAAIGAAWSSLQAFAAGAPRQVASVDSPPFVGKWAVAGGSPATPPRVQDWLRSWVSIGAPLTKNLLATIDAAEAILGKNTILQRERRRGDEESLHRATDLRVPTVEVPALTPETSAAWREAIAALRRLSEATPWFFKARLDETTDALVAWLEDADQNHERRVPLIHRIDSALAARDEHALDRLPLKPDDRDFCLIDQPRLRNLSNFWLGRLRFSRARAVPPEFRRHPLRHYAPILLALLGAPLQAIQTDYLYMPLLKEAAASPGGPVTVHVAAVIVVFLAGSFAGLGSELRRRLSGLSTKEVAQRAVLPISFLLVVNYGLAAFTCWVSPPEVGVPGLTIALWGTLSLVMSLVFGLIAQGNAFERPEPGE